MKKKSKKMTKSEAILILIIGLFLGSVFTLGSKYMYGPVARENTKQVTVELLDVKKNWRKGKVHEITLCCNNHEQYYIHNVLINEELCDSICEMLPGILLDMRIYPNSNYLLEMRVGNRRLIKFEDSIKKFSSYATGIKYLGIFLYAMALVGAGKLLLLKWCF